MTFERKPIPQGFTCTTCETFHKFDGYVYAHGNVVLTHTCKNCGAQHDILAFRATQTKPGVKP